MIIVPTILAKTWEKFLDQFKKAISINPPHIHIDVMDGAFVSTKSFKEIERVKKLKTNLQFELHLMVNDPAAEMRKWQAVEPVFRVLFHIEAPTDPLRVLTFMKKEGWERGIALNPETPLSAALPFLDKIDVLQFMTVHPGRQGAPFVEEVKDKVASFTNIRQRRTRLGREPINKFPPKADPPLAETSQPLCAVDGGVNKSNIAELAKLGVDVANVGSALTQAEDIEQTYQELLDSLKFTLT